MIPLIVSAFLLGFLGSFHCIGMCGPIALSLPIHSLSKTKKIVAIALYNIGRGITYSAIGAIMGLIGQQISIFGYQQKFSIIVGSIILLTIIFAKVFDSPRFAIHKKFSVIKNVLGKLLKSTPHVGTFLFIGMANGLLPCGLVYVALSSALVIGSVSSSALFMFVFSLGTMPLMISIMVLGKFISVSFRSKIHKLVPVFIGFTAVLLILRGLNLGIPYVSPSYQKQNNKVENCCHKN